ncbi:unnamed protein product [Prorocentrum cordatum]|uniref:Uncharacterized protein n=1 Tax=Prorocentrum cordatum TaxID=2364126 RepID=A0ABN9UIN0_9DINO|nr:unnamed protein product [Polarella glacialis]
MAAKAARAPPAGELRGPRLDALLQGMPTPLRLGQRAAARAAAQALESPADGSAAGVREEAMPAVADPGVQAAQDGVEGMGRWIAPHRRCVGDAARRGARCSPRRRRRCCPRRCNGDAARSTDPSCFGPLWAFSNHCARSTSRNFPTRKRPEKSMFASMQWARRSQATCE